MGLFNKMFGYRWSLYIVRNGKELVYAMHDNSVLHLIGYIIFEYQSGKKPRSPWSIHLNYNKNHTSFELLPEHFTKDGNVSDVFKKQIISIDPDWMNDRGGNNPVFIEVATKKKLKIQSRTNYSNLQEEIDNMNSPKDLTFFDILFDIFDDT